MTRYLARLAILALFVAGLTAPAAARGFGAGGTVGGPGGQSFGGHPDAHVFTGRPDAHFFVGRPDAHFFAPGRRPIFLDRRRHGFVSPRVVTFDRFGRPLFPFWAWPYWYDVPTAWLYGPPVMADATVTPNEADTATAGRNCRQFHTTLTIDGRQEPVQGTACQWLDGTWHIAG